MKNKKLYVIFLNYYYGIDEKGNLVASHLSLDEMKKFNLINYYDIVFLDNNEPEDLQTWQKLVKLNRSLEPKE